MATVATNPLVNGLSGMLGRTIVFRQLRGKTIMANTPSLPTRQSEQQKVNRSKFRDASRWAHQVLLDPARKAYYQKKAKKLKLPNAYTAAITDYMRSPRLRQNNIYADKITISVSKKDFAIKKIEVKTTAPAGNEINTTIITPNAYGECDFAIPKADAPSTTIHVYGESGKATLFEIRE